jgi:hypothetical protein
MSQLSKGPIVVQRAKSLFETSKLGPLSPDFTIEASYSAAPGAVGRFLFVAPRPCRVVGVRYVSDVNGAADSKVFLRKHVAGQTAAANATTSGANIVDLVTSGIAADSTARAVTSPAVVSANATMAAGDKLAIVTPATWVGAVTILMAWL